jgi:hypothetical protein
MWAFAWLVAIDELRCLNRKQGSSKCKSTFAKAKIRRESHGRWGQGLLDLQSRVSHLFEIQNCLSEPIQFCGRARIGLRLQTVAYSKQFA